MHCIRRDEALPMVATRDRHDSNRPQAVSDVQGAFDPETLAILRVFLTRVPFRLASTLEYAVHIGGTRFEEEDGENVIRPASCALGSHPR